MSELSTTLKLEVGDCNWMVSETVIRLRVLDSFSLAANLMAASLSSSSVLPSGRGEKGLSRTA